MFAASAARGGFTSRSSFTAGQPHLIEVGDLMVTTDRGKIALFTYRRVLHGSPFSVHSNFLAAEAGQFPSTVAIPVGRSGETSLAEEG